MVILAISIFVLVIATPFIAICVESAKSSTIEKWYEREYQEKHKRLESEYAEKEAALKEREQYIALQEYKLTTADERSRQAAEKIREAEELKHRYKEWKQQAAQYVDDLVAERESELDRRELNIEETIARKVASGIRGKEIGINKNWEYLFRKEHKLTEYEKKILNRAQLIAKHLDVPIRYILTPREKKLVDRSANELAREPSVLTEEHYELMDLVMSCPEDQLKDMLASMQRFDQSWPESPPPPPASEN